MTLDQRRGAVRGEVPLDPVGVVHAEAGAREDVEAAPAEAGDGHVGLDASALVAHLGIDDGADRPVHVGDREALHGSQRSGAHQLELGEAGLIDQDHAVSRRVMLVGDEPLPARSRNESRSTGSTPSGANHRGRSQPFFEPYTAPRSFRRAWSGLSRNGRATPLSWSRVAHLVVMGIVLDRARIHERPARVMGGEPPDIERPEVQAGPPVQDPLRDHLSRPSPRGDAVEESRRQHQVREPGGGPHDEVAVRRVGDRAVDHPANADLAENRHHFGGEGGEGLESIEILRQKLSRELARNPVVPERHGVGLVAADDEAAGGIGLEVHQPVGIPERRQSVGKSGDWLGHHVLVLDRAGGDVNADLPPELPAPHAGREGDGLRLPGALGGQDRRNPAAGHLEIEHLHALAQPGAVQARPGRDGLAQTDRVHVAVGRE